MWLTRNPRLKYCYVNCILTLAKKNNPYDKFHSFLKGFKLHSFAIAQYEIVFLGFINNSVPLIWPHVLVEVFLRIINRAGSIGRFLFHKRLRSRTTKTRISNNIPHDVSERAQQLIKWWTDGRNAAANRTLRNEFIINKQQKNVDIVFSPLLLDCALNLNFLVTFYRFFLFVRQVLYG